MNSEEKQLIEQCQKGDQKAFETLVHRYKRRAVNIAYGLLGQPVEAEDIAQEAFIKVYLSIKQLKNAAAFSVWLTRIITNLCMDKRRKQLSHGDISLESLGDHVQPLENSCGAQNITEQVERKLLIQQAMQKLSDEHRTVVVLRDLQGFSYVEIAEILDVPLGTVKSRLSGARQELKRLLGELRGD